MNKKVLSILLLTATFFSIRQLMFNKTELFEVPELLASSRSKEFCSCYFILKNTRNYCLDQVLKGYPLFEFEVGDDFVTFSNPLYRSTSEVSKDKKYGCLFKK